MSRLLKVIGGTIGSFLLAYLAYFQWGVSWHKEQVEANFERGRKQGISESSEKVNQAHNAASEAKNALTNQSETGKRAAESIKKYESDAKQYLENAKTYVTHIERLQNQVRQFSGCPVLGQQYIEVNKKIKSLYDDRMSPWGTSGNPQIAATMRETIDRQIADFGIQRKSLEEQLGGCPK